MFCVAIPASSGRHGTLREYGANLLVWDVVEVVPEPSGAGQVDARLSTPHRIARKNQHDDTLAILQTLGSDRNERIAIDQTDQVWSRGHGLPVKICDEVFILEFDGSGVPARAPDTIQLCAAKVEATAGLAGHVADLCLNQAHRTDLVEQSGTRRRVSLIRSNLFDGSDGFSDELRLGQGVAHSVSSSHRT